METAFAHLGNHLVSDSTSNINAGDDESILDAFPHRRRKDDEETDVFDDDDIETESMASMAVDGKAPKQDEEVELPAHACACVVNGQCYIWKAKLMRLLDTVASITLELSLNA